MPHQKNRKSMFGASQGANIDLINKILREGESQADDVGDPKTAEDIQKLINIFHTLAEKIKRVQK